MKAKLIQMTVSFLSGNKIFRYMIMIIVILSLPFVCQSGIKAKEMKVKSGFAEARSGYADIGKARLYDIG